MGPATIGLARVGSGPVVLEVLGDSQGLSPVGLDPVFWPLVVQRVCICGPGVIRVSSQSSAQGKPCLPRCQPPLVARVPAPYRSLGGLVFSLHLVVPTPGQGSPWRHRAAGQALDGPHRHRSYSGGKKWPCGP
uniref:Uncharacterized protein n=1 Tax=Myotis myotis TaxID=51298 RepID=A0A7J7TIH8_MYOMY|nr:hypothetical protein mMyoMyo1_009058 [Myotis myotis]